MDWESGAGLLGCADPAEVDAAFTRGEPLVGVAVIGLSLSCGDATAVLDRVVRAIESDDPELCRQGLVALGNVARLDGTVDAAALAVLRRLLADRSETRVVRGAAEDAADDVEAFVPRGERPGWLRRHQWCKRVRWRLWDRWPWSGWSRWRRRAR